MSKRFIVTRKNGMLEDWGADDVLFTQTHVLFVDEARAFTHALHADEVREIEVQEEG